MRAPCSGVMATIVGDRSLINQPAGASLNASQEVGPHKARVKRVGRHARPLDAPRQLVSEQDVGELRLLVGFPAAVLLLELNIVEIDG